MAKTKFKFTTAEGHVATRNSERTYTHVVVGRVDLVAERSRVAADSGHYAATWTFNSDMAAVEVGARMWPNKPYLMSAGESARHRAFIAANPDREAYVAACRERALADLAKRYGAGDKSQELVLQWSMSETNARKAAPGYSHYANVAVKPVDLAPTVDDNGGTDWVPAADPDAWKAADAALLAARRARA